MAGKARNIQGRTFGKLTVGQVAYKSPKSGQYWACECVCGRGRIVLANRLLSGATKACEACARKSLLESLDRRKFDRPDWRTKLSSFEDWQLRGYRGDLKRRIDQGVTITIELQRALVNIWYRMKAAA